MSDKIDAVLKSAVDEGQVPGVTAMAAGPTETLYKGAHGIRALPNGAAMTPDSVFWIASMTKAITSTAAMIQVERGKLQLDTPIEDVVPELKGRQVFEGYDGNMAKLRPPKSKPTLRQLLTHTAGFSYDIWNADLGRYMEENEIPGVISCENKALSTPLTFDPGTRWDYGINIDWAGKAVEASSGQTLGQFFAENIFGPLGMTSIGFKLTEDMRSRLVGMHTYGEDGKLGPMEFEIPQQPEFEMGGGGMYGTVADYTKFMQVFLNAGKGANGHQLLKPETVAEMSRNNIGDVDVVALKTAIPPYSNDAEFFPGMQKKWGLGFMINTADVPGRRKANSLNWAGLGNTYFWIDPTSKICGVIMTQLVPFADPTVLGLLDRFEEAVYARA
ncbi:MAG: serine hydrolase domain-containing protein [Alphaproteobacteria bacterium]